MNTVSANAPPARIRPLRTLAQAARRLGDLIVPRDHAGKGNWSKDTDIPWQAWPLGIGLASFVIWGWDFLDWLLRLAI